MSQQPEPPASIAKALREFLKRSNGVSTLGAEDSMARAVWDALLAEGRIDVQPRSRRRRHTRILVVELDPLTVVEPRDTEEQA